MKSVNGGILYIFLAAAASACNTGGCYDNQSALPKAAFYNSADGKAISLATVEIHGIGAPGDSVLVRAGTATSELYLPMRPGHDETAWCFHYTQNGIDDPAFDDTVTVRYETRPYFASEECGAMYIYDVRRLTCTTHLIDSVVIADSLITNVDAVYWKVYFKTSETSEDSEDSEPTL